jgi:phage major head subunit gpT-like protein
LVSFGHCVVCPSFDLHLLISLWYLLAIVLSVLPLIYEIKGRTDNTMAKRYQREIRSRKSKEGQTTQWSEDTKIALWYLLAIVLSVLPLIYGF